MKQKLIALLKTSFASKGFNATELEKLADVVIGQNTLTDESADEDLTTAVTNAKPFADFVQSVASRQVSDVKKPKVEEPKPLDAPKPDKAPEGETAEQKSLRLILEKLEKQDAVIASMQGEKVTNTRRDQFIKSMEGTSKEYQTRELKKFDLYTFRDDDHFNEVIAGFKDDHAAAIQEEANSGLGGERPAGGSGSTPKNDKVASSDLVDEIMNGI